MKGTDITAVQRRAAEVYILLRRSGNQKHLATPKPDDKIAMPWKDLVMLVAEYGAIRAFSIGKGGSVEEPGEVYFTGKDGL